MKKQIRKLVRKIVFCHSSNRALDNRTLCINGLCLTVDSGDAGGRMYEGKRSYEELSDPLYVEISKEFNPSLVIDVGANYGFTGLIFATKFPNSKVLLIEASNKLCAYLKDNFEQNRISNFQVIHAICGDVGGEQAKFSINPTSSQDNRVIAESSDWRNEMVATVTLKDVIEKHFKEGCVFIKIDAQGYEERVFRGGYSFLDEKSNWIIKTEFAPYWLRSQGTNPVDFLEKLTSKFQVVELPVRTRYIGNSLADLFAHKLHPSDAKGFVNYIQFLDKDDRGWCDLLICPRS